MEILSRTATRDFDVTQIKLKQDSFQIIDAFAPFHIHAIRWPNVYRFLGLKPCIKSYISKLPKYIRSQRVVMTRNKYWG